MKEKIITFRADNQDLERIEQIKKTYLEKYQIKITTSDVLSAGILNLWNKECLPYKEGKITF